MVVEKYMLDMIYDSVEKINDDRYIVRYENKCNLVDSKGTKILAEDAEEVINCNGKLLQVYMDSKNRSSTGKSSYIPILNNIAKPMSTAIYDTDGNILIPFKQFSSILDVWSESSSNSMGKKITSHGLLLGANALLWNEPGNIYYITYDKEVISFDDKINWVRTIDGSPYLFIGDEGRYVRNEDLVMIAPNRFEKLEDIVFNTRRIKEVNSCLNADRLDKLILSLDNGTQMELSTHRVISNDILKGKYVVCEINTIGTVLLDIQAGLKYYIKENRTIEPLKYRTIYKSN